MSTRFPSSAVTYGIGVLYEGKRGCERVVEWAPREFNKEPDQLANGVVDASDPTRRLHVSAQSLSWIILPEALEAGETQRAFQDMEGPPWTTKKM